MFARRGEEVQEEGGGKDARVCRHRDGLALEDRVGGRDIDGVCGSCLCCDEDVPFEFVGEIARSSAVAEASDVESCTTGARHDALLSRIGRWMTDGCRLDAKLV